MKDRELLWIVNSFIALNIIVTGTQLNPDIWYKWRHSVLKLKYTIWFLFYRKCEATVRFLIIVTRIVWVHHAKLRSKSMWAKSCTATNPHWDFKQVEPGREFREWKLPDCSIKITFTFQQLYQLPNIPQRDHTYSLNLNLSCVSCYID